MTEWLDPALIFFVPYSASARLDLPTSEDAAVQQKLSRHQMQYGGVPWSLIGSLRSLGSLVLQLASQIFVLLQLLQNQNDSVSLVLWSFAGPVLQYIERQEDSLCRCIFFLQRCRVKC